jgi:serine/threonine protein kinase/tetratricopeptide (TPR) repeat protein
MPAVFDERWQCLSEHLDHALDLAEPERIQWLAAVERADPEMAALVKSLLAGRDRAGFSDFLAGTSPLPAEEAASATLVERHVGPYVIDAEIGRGGMGSVWRARRADGRFEGTVAIKFVHAAWIGRAGEQRFRTEGNLLGRLDHSNIARLIDAGVVDATQPYLVLEYVEGEPIDMYCERLVLTVEARVNLFLSVLAAVAHAHSHLIVHRDIKPANVFVTRDGTVKLLDFGIAKLLDDGSGSTILTKSSATALTPQYAAPEQLLGQPVTTATDVYSLGLVLYLLLTGVHPLASELGSSADLMRAVLTKDPLRASTVTTLNTTRRRSLEGDLDNILGKALKKTPTERYASASAFADDLRRFLIHEPVGARPDTVAYRVSKFARRHRGGVALASLALVASIAGAIGTFVQAHDARVQRDFAFRQLARAEAITDLNSFLLSDAAPSGKAFTVNDLLGRAVHIVGRQQGAHDATQVEILVALGLQYAYQEDDFKGLPLLEQAYRLSQALHEPSTRARAACALGFEVSRNRALPRATQLVAEGLAELPNEPQFALDRVFCLRQSSTVALNAGEGGKSVSLAQSALRELRDSPFDSDLMELHTVMDVAESFREAGQYYQAIPLFKQVSGLMTKTGRDDTQTAGTLFNNWALALSQLGQPLEAERLFRHAIELNRTDPSEQTVSPMLLNNYARTLKDLSRLDQAAEIAERAYAIAKRIGDDQVVDQSLSMRAQIYLEQNDHGRAASMLTELEPRLRRHLPPGHNAFASLLANQALVASARDDFQTAIALANEAVAIGEAATKSGAQGAIVWSVALVRRARVELAGQRPADADADALRAVRVLKPTIESGCCSASLGNAYLTLARARQAQGALGGARSAAQLAVDQFMTSVGADNPATNTARELALGH